MEKKYMFCLAVGRVSIEDEITLEFDDNATPEEIESIVSKEYAEWVSEKNGGYYQEIE